MSLKKWADAIGVPYGTFKDWAYRRLKEKKGIRLKAPFYLNSARKIAIEGTEASQEARGNSEEAGLRNYQRCSEFLLRTKEDAQTN